MKISVCMATYNGDAYIKPQIDSILTQLSENDELIISDDSSTDETIQIIRQTNDKRIRLFEGNTFGSPIFNFEYALKQASGKIVFLADQDDLWLPGKVRIMTDALVNCDLAVSDCSVIDDAGEVIAPSFYTIRHSGSGLLKNIYKNTYLGCCMAFRAKVLDWALPFPKNIPMHDMWLGLTAEMFGTTKFCSQTLSHYRRHGKNVSPEINQSHFSLFQKINFRFILIYRLFQRKLRQRSNSA
ncbi:MAG: glycosyltransferase family 2 protein [Planctomycetota bacterium]